MLFRKSLISMSLLALMVASAQAQDKTSQPSDKQPEAQQTQTPSDPTGVPSGMPPVSTPPVPQDPAPTPDTTSSTKPDATPSGQTPIQEPDESKVKHDGGKADVDAIGNRKIGGRGMGNWYSLETEIKMGKQYAMQVESTVKLVQDPVVSEYVNRIGQNLVRNSDAQVPFTIKVIDSDEVNAFALPGGFFYVNTGLILA